MIEVLGLIFLTTILFYNFYWKRRNLPPGPTPLPLIGNIHTISFDKDPYDTYAKWSKIYGPVHTFWLGEKPVIAVTDFNLLKETFIKDGDSYTGRDFFTEFWCDVRGGDYGISVISGNTWKNQRRFAIHVLRNFGMGRNIIEKIIMNEVERLIDWSDSAIASKIEEHSMLNIVEVCVGSIINSALLGYRFIGENEHEFYRLRALLTESIRLLGHPFMNMLGIKFLKNFPYIKNTYYQIYDTMHEIDKFFEQQISKNEKMYSSEENVEETTNYVQAFLSEMKRREKNGEDKGDFNYNQLRGVLSELWSAGQDTTATTIQWGILYLMTHPNVQQKLQAELDNKVGNDRQVLLADRQNLPYTNAVINEIQRLCNLLPVNLFHKTTQNVMMNGYCIEKGTTIVPQISMVLFDEKLFPNPRKFEPERFLDKNGQVKKFEELVPFSVGKRICLGESLARDELFLVIANFFHEFYVMPKDPKNPPTLEKIKGFGVRPHAYNVCLKRRISAIN